MKGLVVVIGLVYGLSIVHGDVSLKYKKPMYKRVTGTHELNSEALPSKKSLISVHPDEGCPAQPLEFVGDVDAFLQDAARSGVDMETLLRGLLRKKAPLRTTNNINAQTIAWFLAVQDSLKAVQDFLADPNNDGFDINTQHPVNMRTALHYAAEQYRTDVCDFLLKNGASITVLDSSKRSALSWAASSGSLDVCKLLLNAGANVFITLPGQGTSFVFTSPDYFTAMVIKNSQSLLTKLQSFKGINTAQIMGGVTSLLTQIDPASGTDVSAIANATDVKGKTALHYAAAITDLPTAKAVCTILLQAGANAQIKDEAGATSVALVPATNKEVYDLLIKGIPAGTLTPSVVVQQENTSIASKWFTLISGGTAAQVADFLGNNLNFDVNSKNADGYTALQIAVQKAGAAPLCTFLLERGADITAVGSYNKLGIVTFDKDISITDKNIKDLLISTLGLLWKSTRATATAADIQKYLDAGAVPNATDKTGNTPLHFLAANNAISNDTNTPLCTALLGAGANGLARNAFGNLPSLYVAPNSNCQKLLTAVQMLFTAVNHVTTMKSFMSDGIKEAFKSIASFPAGTDIALANARDRLGRTPLHYAVAASDFDACKLLFSTYEVDPKAKDFSGKKPADLLDSTNNAAASIQTLLFSPPTPVLIPSSVEALLLAAVPPAATPAA